MSAEPLLDLTNDRAGLRLTARGAWTAANAAAIDRAVDALLLPPVAAAPALTVDLGGVTEFDTFGARLVERLVRLGAAQGRRTDVVALPLRYQGLVDAVSRASQAEARPPPAAGWVARVRAALAASADGLALTSLAILSMIGAIAYAVVRVVRRPASFRLTSAVHHLDRVGWQAVPIILLITFLIGCIIAQQGFFHFRKLGADDYVVDMVGILVLREIGVLIVAIMVAGRSGSSYTAELGSMRMREEIDALRTMGFDPVEVLVLPRVTALVAALPILAFLGSMSALLGGGFVAWAYGGMSPDIFLVRLKEAISITHFEVGMIKAPFMAMVIGAVACAEGFRVEGSAESLGLHTTQSVVKSIFLVIVLDGVFAMFFASIGM